MRGRFISHIDHISAATLNYERYGSDGAGQGLDPALGLQLIVVPHLSSRLIY